jgi:hypothetical protein
MRLRRSLESMGAKDSTERLFGYLKGVVEERRNESGDLKRIAAALESIAGSLKGGLGRAGAVSAGAAEPGNLLGPKEVARILGVSQRTAERIMKRAKGLVVIGTGERPRLRLPRRALDRYVRSGGDRQLWQKEDRRSEYTCEETSGGAGDTAIMASGGTSRRTKGTTKQQSLSLVVSTGKELFPPIVPRRRSR